MGTKDRDSAGPQMDRESTHHARPTKDSLGGRRRKSRRVFRAAVPPRGPVPATRGLGTVAKRRRRPRGPAVAAAPGPRAAVRPRPPLARRPRQRGQRLRRRAEVHLGPQEPPRPPAPPDADVSRVRARHGRGRADDARGSLAQGADGLAGERPTRAKGLGVPLACPRDSPDAPAHPSSAKFGALSPKGSEVRHGRGISSPDADVIQSRPAPLPGEYDKDVPKGLLTMQTPVPGLRVP